MGFKKSDLVKKSFVLYEYIVDPYNVKQKIDNEKDEQEDSSEQFSFKSMPLAKKNLKASQEGK